MAHAAAEFQDRAGYAAAVLRGRDLPGPSVRIEGPSTLGLSYGLASAAAAVAVALVALFRRRLVAAPVRRRFRAVFGRPLLRLRALHSGHVGDYAAWFTVGLAMLTGLFVIGVVH